MTGDQPYGAGGNTRAQALERVEAASTERSRIRDEHERAKGTSSELQSDMSLRAANAEVSARERWLDWVQERDY
jgi:hypothetical protein